MSFNLPGRDCQYCILVEGIPKCMHVLFDSEVICAVEVYQGLGDGGAY